MFDDQEIVTGHDQIRITGVDRRGVYYHEVHDRLWFKICKGVWFVAVTEIREIENYD